MYEISFMSKYQRKTRILSTFMIPFIKINNLTQYIIKMTEAGLVQVGLGEVVVLHVLAKDLLN